MDIIAKASANIVVINKREKTQFWVNYPLKRFLFTEGESFKNWRWSNKCISQDQYLKDVCSRASVTASTCMLVISNMMPPTASRERAGKSMLEMAKESGGKNNL